jgi:hypothetical protein
LKKRRRPAAHKAFVLAGISQRRDGETLRLEIKGPFSLCAWLVVSYNRLVKLRGQADAACADIDVQLKRHPDLIPNLVETVKGSAGHECTTFEKVTEARPRAMAAGRPVLRVQAEALFEELCPRSEP